MKSSDPNHWSENTIWDSTDNTTKWIEVIALCVGRVDIQTTPSGHASVGEPHMNVAADDLTIKDGGSSTLVWLNTRSR